MSLFDAGPKRDRHGTTKALVAVEADRCPRCAATTTAETVTEAPLLRHGGYGAARRTRRVYCGSCPWWMTTCVDEIRP